MWLWGLREREYSCTCTYTDVYKESLQGPQEVTQVDANQWRA